MNIKQKIYIASGLFLIIVIFLIWVLVKPLILEIKTTSALAKEANQKLVVLEKTDQDYLRRVENDYKDIEENISLIKAGFLNTNQIVDFFIELEDIAFSTSNQLEIEASEISLFTLFLLGDFPNLMKFLGWLENGKYFLEVNSIQIKQFAEKGRSLEEEAVSAGDIKSTLRIKTYFGDGNFYEKGENFKID